MSSDAYNIDWTLTSAQLNVHARRERSEEGKGIDTSERKQKKKKRARYRLRYSVICIYETNERKSEREA